MKARRVFRANRKSVEQREQERKLRDKLQKERPSLEDLVRKGACDPDAVMTMGMYFDIQRALQALKKERERSGISIGDVAERSGIDRAVVSRLENGKQDNPTVATLMRYAAALGKRFMWSYEDLKLQDILEKSRQQFRDGNVLSHEGFWAEVGSSRLPKRNGRKKQSARTRRPT